MEAQHLKLINNAPMVSPYGIYSKLQVEQWAKQVGLTSADGSVEERVDWSSLIHCYAQSSAENLVLIAKWNYWFTFANDFVENLLAFEDLTEALLENIIDFWTNCLESEQDESKLQKTFLDHPLLDLWKTCKYSTSESWCKLFIKNFDKYWKEKIKEERNLEHSTLAAKYSKQEFAKAKFRIDFHFIELAASLKFDETLVEDELFEEFVDKASLVMAYITEIYSYSWDSGNARNLISAVRRERDCSGEAAIREITKLQNCEFDEMKEIGRQFMCKSSKDVDAQTCFLKYTEGLMFFVHQTASLLQIGDFKK